MTPPVEDEVIDEVQEFPLTTSLPPLPTIESPRPFTPRRATAPDTPTAPSPFSSLSVSSLPLRPRPRSPFARGHLRSKSSGTGSLTAPQMTRAHSSPVPNTTGRPVISRPASPLGPPLRHRSPMRRQSDESFSSFSNQLDIDLTISENSELDLTPRATMDFDSVPASPSPPYNNYQTFPRSRRRPASPLHQISLSAFSSNTSKHSLRASTSTPSLAASQYNEVYPSYYSLSSGSVPSTPTSLRSRSPSISSLETIPDSPDAEREAENIALLKAAADREDQSEEGIRRRAGSDVGVRGAGRGDKRKRWSVCGAERRGDLDLETIWED
ncbi:MAG: hypothetical protein ALECFALPRED_003049 [Alectoria fallacina]|uniref:Basic proline-rich protein n=1 Tax=Alectoria fallacina TaxID=1903189 RepID=A0A8H3HXY4_9LECA|nr:MAG: hypothetical protein ALECFALPRED_003049 [Alectoria fallacina]